MCMTILQQNELSYNYITVTNRKKYPVISTGDITGYFRMLLLRYSLVSMPMYSDRSMPSSSASL